MGVSHLPGLAGIRGHIDAGEIIDRHGNIFVGDIECRRIARIAFETKTIEVEGAGLRYPGKTAIVTLV